ncbi:carbohydrate ABC transporter permease [Limnochorda pilosa]|uniref:carbohydrate ABC transporter permease n=1 Tax=Limnochorda pilosa TaxID=1555112 RepID=UPI00130E4E87|nr:carbohydrate ABC transporter permease [Limnochorda pilosa]
MARESTVPAPQRRGRLRWGDVGARLLVLGYLIVLYFPIYWMVTMAFKRRVDITIIPPRFIFKPILRNFEWLFVHQDIWGPITRGFMVSVASVAIAIVLGTMAAYALARFRWWRQNDLEYWIVSTRMLPPVAVIIPYYYLWMKFRMLDTLTGLGITYLTINLPLVIWLLIGFFRSIPREMDDAARVDGCSPLQAFWYIALPMARGAVGAAAILAFIFTWNDFFFAFILTTVNFTLPVALSSFMTVGLEVKYGEMAAAGLLAAIPSLVLAILARKWIVTGFRGMAGIAATR